MRTCGKSLVVDSSLNDELPRGFASQNRLCATIASLVRGTPEVANQVKSFQMPVYQADLTAITDSFMRAIKAVKAEAGHDLNATRELTSQSVKKIFDELTKGQSKPKRKITAMQVADALAKSVADLPGVDTETVKQLFLVMTGTVVNQAKATANE